MLKKNIRVEIKTWSKFVNFMHHIQQNIQILWTEETAGVHAFSYVSPQ